MARRLAGLLGLLMFAASSGALAATTTTRVTLRWNAPDTCPDDAELVRSVEGFLGQPLSESREQQLGVSVNVQGGGDGFSAKLAFDGPRGEEQRYLEHPDCNKLMEAAALLVALTIDPDRVKARRSDTANEGSLPRTDRPAPEPEPRPESAATPRRTAKPSAPASAAPVKHVPPVRPTMSLAAFAGSGPLPSLAPGVAAELGLRYTWFRAAAIGRYWAPATADIQGLPGSSIRLSLASAGLRACGVQALRAWAAVTAGCLGADLSQMSGSGEGVDNARTRDEAFATVNAGASLAYARSALAPVLGLELSWAITRPRFGVLSSGGERDAFRPKQWGLLGSFGLALGL